MTEILALVAGWLIVACGVMAMLLAIFVVIDLVDGLIDGRYRTHPRHMLDGVAIAALAWVVSVVLLRLARGLLALA